MSEKFIGRPRCFTREYIERKRVEKGLTSLANLEKALFALEYVGQLEESGLSFVFKGGSAVQILLGDRWSRLSTDVDITTGADHEEIKKHLSGINRKFRGKCFSYEKRRVFNSGVPFYLYRLKTMPITGSERAFLLDIMGEEVDYNTQNTPLNSFFYESNIKVDTPTTKYLEISYRF
ncbi:MAG: nucleotidyl transferase AbiEii/AbiGii toxin family protein [Candidatus Bathyarchaeia archaeon]